MNENRVAKFGPPAHEALELSSTSLVIKKKLYI